MIAAPHVAQAPRWLHFALAWSAAIVGIGIATVASAVRGLFGISVLADRSQKYPARNASPDESTVAQM